MTGYLPMQLFGGSVLAVMNRVVCLNGPSRKADLASVGAGFKYNGILTDAYHEADDSAGCNDLVANLQVAAHTLNLFLLLFLGPDQKEVEYYKDKDDGANLYQ